MIVQPETVIRWHRQGFRLYWRRKSRSQPPGRPPIDSEIQELILEMHDGQVVFPNLGLACNGGDEPPEYYQAWARAHNDFVWEVFAVEEDWSPGWGD